MFYSAAMQYYVVSWVMLWCVLGHVWVWDSFPAAAADSAAQLRPAQLSSGAKPAYTSQHQLPTKTKEVTRCEPWAESRWLIINNNKLIRKQLKAIVYTYDK